MVDPYFQKLFAERIGGAGYGKGTDLYKFEKIKRAKRAAIADFPDRPLIDFGIGENDDMAAADVRQEMKLQVDDPRNRGYADNGIIEYKQAASHWMKREFNVLLDPVAEINHCIGSKSALAMLPGIFINPGDITIMTVPGYPVAGNHTKYYGGEVVNLPLRRENGFLPDLESLSPEVRSRAKLLVINFPNSPTGALATERFYLQVIDFARAHEIVVINDAAHSMLSFGQPPTSFLQVEGAKDVGVELHSMSKGFNMIGWRLGFLAGNERIVRAYADFKDNGDSGQFMAVQRAGVTALNNPEIPRSVRAKYNRRLQKLVTTLNTLGFHAEMPGGTYFLYVEAPIAVKASSGAETKFHSAEEVSQFLIRERSICTVPWDDAGPFLRFSVTYHAESETAEDELMGLLGERLKNDTLIWKEG